MDISAWSVPQQSMLLITAHYVERLRDVDGENRRWFPPHSDPLTEDTKSFHKELGELLASGQVQ